MKKKIARVSSIGTADGPTSVILLKKDAKAKLSVKQKIKKWNYQRKKTNIEKMIKPQSHSLDELMEYIVTVHGFVELDKDLPEVIEEYHQMRTSFLLQYAPELLGELAVRPKLNGESEQEVQCYLKQTEEYFEKIRKKALEIPTTVFDIEYHKFERKISNQQFPVRRAFRGEDEKDSCPMGVFKPNQTDYISEEIAITDSECPIDEEESQEDTKDTMYLMIEKRYAYLGGGAVGNSKVNKEFEQIWKEIHRYYGVTKEDIEQNSKRYQEMVRVLSR